MKSQKQTGLCSKWKPIVLKAGMYDACLNCFRQALLFPPAKLGFYCFAWTLPRRAADQFDFGRGEP